MIANAVRDWEAFDVLEVGVTVQDLQANILYANATAQELLAREEADLVGRTSHDPTWAAIHSDGTPMPGREHPVVRCITEGVTVRSAVMGVWREHRGDRIWLSVSARPIRDATGAIDHVVCTFSNITEEHEIRERQILEKQELYQSVFDAMAEGMMVVDAIGRVRELNPAAERILECDGSELRGRLLALPPGAVDEAGEPLSLEHYPPICSAQLGEALRDQVVGFSLASGDRRWISMNTELVFHGVRSGPPRFVVTTFSDITQERRFEEVLRHRQRIEILGDLAAGVAHNFNNALMVIVSGVEQALAAPGPEANSALGDALKSARAAGALVHQLNLMARRDADPRNGTCDLAALAEEVVGMCRRIFDGRIQLELTRPFPRAPVRANPSLIQHVLLNLCLNARDAMGAVACPRIALQLTRTLGPIPGASSAAPSHWTLTVEDNGSGIAPEVARRIGEPFFTTKGHGVGTGLGLATSFGIIREAGGVLRFRSEPGEGTTFELCLPELESTRRTPSPPPRTAPLMRGRVLLVDDDPLVRRAIARILTRSGLQVSEAGDAEGARALLEGPRPDVAIIDFAMPEMRGDELLERMLKTWPGTPVVILSGHVPAHAALAGAAAVIHKPVGTQELIEVLRPLLTTSA